MKDSQTIFVAKLALTLTGFVVFLGFVAFFFQQNSNYSISKSFAEQLYTYPIPPHTKLLSKQQVNEKQLIAGSGGYWGVVASAHYTTSLPPKEILSYYEKAGMFRYPGSENKGVKLELYMSPNVKKVFSSKGNYYEDKGKGRLFVCSYYRNPSLLNDSTRYAKNQETWQYVIQLTSDFDYALHFN